MFSKEIVRGEYKTAMRLYFEEKYKLQFQSILAAAKDRKRSIVFSQETCPFELAEYLMDELGFSLYRLEKDYWVPIFEVEEFKNCKEVQVRW